MRRFGQLSDLSSYDSQVTAYQQSVQNSVQTYVQQTGAQGAAYVNSLTGSAQNTQQVTNGINNLVAVVQSYDPSSASDNGKIVASISGGLCLIPGVGPLLGAAVESMWVVGNAVACPVSNFFSGILGTPKDVGCGGAPCTTSGNYTAASVLEQNSFPNGILASGSFSLFVLAALANNQAAAGNCRPSMPAGQVVDGAVAIWNEVYGPPAVTVYSPPISTVPGTPLIPTWGSVNNASTGNVDPNLYFAFQPVFSIPASSGGPPFQAPPQGGGAWAWAGLGSLFPLSPARAVQVNTGPMTTAAKAATINGAVSSVALLASLGGLTAAAWPFLARMGR